MLVELTSLWSGNELFMAQIPKPMSEKRDLTFTPAKPSFSVYMKDSKGLGHGEGLSR